jgi:hypothetical protein
MRPTPRVEALLRAGRAEQPPEGNEERLLVGLGLGAGAATGISLAGAAVRTWLRWMGLGLLVGAVSMTSAWAIGAHGPRLEADANLPRRETLDRDDGLVLAPVLLEGRAFAERDAPMPRGMLAPARAADELVPIRDARLALLRGEPTAALSALRDHARAFPQGVFDEEAAALRVEALVAAGRRDDARREADAFDAAYPHSPYGRRVHRELGAPPPEPRTP